MNKCKWQILVIFFFVSTNVIFFTSDVRGEVADSENSKLESTQPKTIDRETETEALEPVTRVQTYAESWAIVSNVSELQTALINKEPYIKFEDSTDAFDFGDKAIPITADVTIDGNGRHVSYDGGAYNANLGLYTATNGLTIKLQNMTFGAADFTLPAVGLYGLMQSVVNTQLHIENVNYFSNKSAQPFYLRNVNSKIYFHGTNQFILQDDGQEFAECYNYEFTEGSHTTIIQNTNNELGCLWMPGNPARITIGEAAVVDITSNHNFIYSDGANNGEINLGRNSKLLVKGTNSAKGDFFYFDKPAFLTVNEGAEFSVSYPNSLKIANGSVFKFLPDSVGSFDIRESEYVFDRTVGVDSTFEINNAQQITFKGSNGATYNPIGFVGGNNKLFIDSFNEKTRGYHVMANDTPLTPQLDAGSWNITNTIISRSIQANTPDFTSSEQTALRNANMISLTRLNLPVELLEVSQDVQVNQANFQLATYQLNHNDDLVNGVKFKLYSEKKSDPSSDDIELIEQQTLDALDDKAAFSNLDEQKEYWLYVQIVCDPNSQSSEWLEVPFMTQQEMINVSFPVEVGFHTKKSVDEQVVISNDTYLIENNSSFAVIVQASDLQELSNPAGINLLTEADETNKKDLFLELREGSQNLGVLTKKLEESPLSFADLAGKTSTTMGFSGTYYGDARKAQQVQYRLVLTVARKE